VAAPAGDGKIWAVWIDGKGGDGYRGWGLPGGHIEGWEDAGEAALRILRRGRPPGDPGRRPYPDLIEEWATTRIFPGRAAASIVGAMESG